MDAIKIITPSDKFNTKQLTIGGLMTLIGFIGLAVGTGYALGGGILFLIMTLIQKDKALIKIFEKNIETKFAPLAATKYINFKDITKIETVNPKKIFIHYTQESKDNKLRIPVQMLDEKDLNDFLTIVRNKLKSN